MKEIIKVQTFDGAEHDSINKALRHLDKLLADTISKHAHNLAGKKYIDVCHYLEKNISDFSLAARIKSDFEIEKYCEND